MSRRPFPWPAGQTQSLRADLYGKLRLPALVGAQIGVVSDQTRSLARGADVTFTREQLQSWYPRGDEHPSLPDLGTSDSWTLTGDDTLTPAS